MTKSAISAFVINLADSKPRLEFQTKQLSHLGIDFERIEATSTADLSESEYEKWANDWQRKLRRTEVACFLSHFGIWQRIAKSNQPYLVLEDDAVLSQDLPNVLAAITALEHLPFEHLSFETRGRKKLYDKECINLTESVRLHPLYIDKSGAAAYLLTPKGAQVLLDTVEKSGAGLADALLCHTKRLNSSQTMPALAIQMDMAKHYDMPELQISPVAASNISTSANSKPSPNSLSDRLAFKSRRLAAQLDIGLIQAKKSSHSDYLEVLPNQRDFLYLRTFI